MGFVGDDGKGNSIGRDFNISDTETQASSSSASGEEFKDGNADELRHLQSTVPFDDTIPLENSLFETQLVNLDFDTQVLDCLDCECDKEVVFDSDGEGTDRTEVLSDADQLSDDESGRRGGDDPVDLEKRQCRPCEKGGKDFVADSDTSADEQHNSGLHVSTASKWDQGTSEPKAGSLWRGFTSVRTASLRASGLAARGMTFKGNSNGPSSIPSKTLSGRQHVTEDSGISYTRDPSPSPFGTEVRDVDQDHETWKCNGNMKGFRDENKCSVGNSTVRKLFTEDTVAGNKGSTRDIESSDGGTDPPQLLVCNHGFAGLSYVGSQEPGESSQANALEFVDRFLSVNNVELSQEDPGKITRGKSPPNSSAKGTQSLAKRASFRRPVGETGIFDWVDSREDDRGGEFFSRRKEGFFHSRGHDRRSFTQPQKPRHVNFKRGRGVVDEFREKEEQLNRSEKTMGLMHSDSRLMLHDSKENDKIVQVSEMKIKKNLVKELDEQLNSEFPGHQLDASGISMDSGDMLDVGFDTQMAAEAMEALFCGAPANYDSGDGYQGELNASERCPRGETENETSLKNVSLRKRDCPSDSGGTVRQSKREMRLDVKSRKKTSTSSRKQSKNQREKLDPESAVKTKAKRAKLMAEQHLNTGNATNGNESSGGQSCKFLNQRKAEGAVDRAGIKEVNRCHHSSSTSNGHLLFDKGQEQEEYRTFTPIVYRTRQKRPKSSSGEVANDLLEVDVHKDKRKGSRSGVDALKSLNFNTNQTGEVGNNKPSQQEQPGLELATTTGCAEKYALSYPRQRRTLRNISGRLNGSGKPDGPSTVVDWEQANGQSITRRKRSERNARSICVNLDMKRKTRSSVYPHLLLSSSEKSSQGRLLRRNLDEPGFVDAAANCNLAVMNEKMIPKDLNGTKASMYSGRKGDAISISSTEVAEGIAALEMSPKEKTEPAVSTCTTPVNSTMPSNVASPICMGDEYGKQSCKKNLSRSHLMKELNRLDATETVPTTLKDLRRRRDMASVRVLFSHHLDEDTIKQQKKILVRLGVPIASSSADATHFITDKFVRTRNMLEAIALGKPVVTHLWLESCGQASFFIDEKNYILRDTKKEKEIGFSMPVSLARACQRPLLQVITKSCVVQPDALGQRVFITPNIKPGKELIAGLVKAVHGQAVERIGRSAMKDDKIPDDLLVLSCEEDYTICLPFLEKGAAVYSSELLLNGIIIQKLEYERPVLV
ncbi:hypothetical protein HHK36_012512 [Tetracentron sinense]|uniref:BRCT domain-containing protein n=1 Tax=Tetracentron sinense TaxID=13715 RepID=A0A835DEM4_TETSI|nr:hypothetical protein HHK36_012512 [Tetracentron sinense]